MSSQQIYLSSNCSCAFQLNWSVSVFGNEGLPSPEGVIDKLKNSVARDDLKILEYRKAAPNVVQFFVSSQPKHSPAEIVRCVKGRWSHAARDNQRIELRRNYCIRSVGAAKSCVLDHYVARQNVKHPMADDAVQAMLESLQYHDSLIDTASLRRSGHGEFLNSLHLVFETMEGWQEANFETLSAYRAMIIDTCLRHQWSLSRIGLLSNHLHILLCAGVADSPDMVAMKLLNELASTQNMRTVFKHSYYVGTFGEFDGGAIWNSMNRDIVSERRGEVYQCL